MHASRTLFALCAVAGLSMPALAGGDICKQTANLQRRAAMADLKEELLVHLAACKNLEDLEARAECEAEAKEEYTEGKALVDAQHDARLALCGLLGGGAYDPQIDPNDFSTTIDNPYFPLPVGAFWMYESSTDEGLEHIEVTVLAETREILGVQCVTVRDVVTLDGVLVEDTLDWYAQDDEGNVWYFGEISFTFDDGYVDDIEGSWVAGVDGAKPGIVMLADPASGVGSSYRQEWFLGTAEDAATVEAGDVPLTIGFGSFEHCVQTAEFQALAPGAIEHKFYAPGIGFIYETKDGSAETLELVGYSGL